VWGSKGTTGAVRWSVSAYAAIPNSTNTTTAVFNAATHTAAITVPATSGILTETTANLDATGFGPGRFCVLMVRRWGSNASDTSTSDAFLRFVTFEYTTS
jgi:hypothetical protein